MLEQSLRKLFAQQAEAEPPPGPITVAAVLRQGRLRRRWHRISAAGAPVLAAVAVAAIALPSGGAGHSYQQSGSYGKLVRGAFDPSYLSIKFGWLPAGYYVSGGESSPGAQALSAYRPRGNNLGVTVYARNACHLSTSRRRLECVLVGSGSGQNIARRGPVIDGHTSWWLADLSGQFTLAWEYAPDSWAVLSLLTSEGPASMVRIARAVAYGQHVPVRFASRFTSLPRGWRIIDVQFDASGDGAGRLPPASTWRRTSRSPNFGQSARRRRPGCSPRPTCPPSRSSG